MNDAGSSYLRRTLLDLSMTTGGMRGATTWLVGCPMRSRAVRKSAPHLFQLERDGRRVGGGDGGGDLGADSEGCLAAAPWQQHKERVGVAVHDARAPLRMPLHQPDRVFQRLSSRLRQKISDTHIHAAAYLKMQCTVSVKIRSAPYCEQYSMGPNSAGCF